MRELAFMTPKEAKTYRKSYLISLTSTHLSAFVAFMALREGKPTL